MSTPPELPGRCPILIGRPAQLDRLARSIEQAATGSGHTLLLGGEAGVGKSRLVAELQHLAASYRFQVLQGRCFEPDALLPYAPLLDLLRAYLSVHDSAGMGAGLGPLTPYLSDLLPELAAHLRPHPPLRPPEPEEQRRRLLQAFVQFFLSQTSGQPERERTPLLVVIEDLHWCDEMSLEVLLALPAYAAGGHISRR
jgi:predicted ATPase